jgi:hypothetical protein
MVELSFGQESTEKQEWVSVGIFGSGRDEIKQLHKKNNQRP